MKSLLEIIVAAVLSFVGIFINIFTLIKSDQSFMPFIFLILYFFTLIYFIYDYKTPHGNLLKTALLAFGFAVCVPLIIGEYSILARITFTFSAVLIAYVAGRLNRIEKNTFIVIIVFIMIFFGATDHFLKGYYMTSGYLKALEHYNYLIIYSVLMITYFSRYKAHIAASKE